MKISKEDSIFLYGVLFHFSLSQDLSSDVRSRVCDLMDLLTSDPEEEIGTDLDEDEEPSEEVDDDSDEDEVEQPSPDECISPSSLGELPQLCVVSPAGDKIQLEFEDVDEEEHVDALLDEGTVIIDAVSHIHVDSTGKGIRLYDGSEWHHFSITKYPKTWSKVLTPGTQYSVGKSEEEDE